MAINFDVTYTTDLDSVLARRSFAGPLIYSDVKAHKIHVKVMRGSATVPVSGITAYLLRSDGTTLVINGTASGNEAVVELPQAAYAVVGNATMAVRATVSGVTNTIALIDFNIVRNSTDTIVDPGNTIPSISDLLAKISAMESATTAAQEVVTQNESRFTSLSGQVEQLFNYSSVKTYSTSEGWKLNGDGYCSSDSGYKLVKFKVESGKTYTVSNCHCFQFNNGNVVQRTGTNYIVGTVHGDGNYVCPNGATYLICDCLNENNPNVLIRECTVLGNEFGNMNGWFSSFNTTASVVHSSDNDQVVVSIPKDTEYIVELERNGTGRWECWEINGTDDSVQKMVSEGSRKIRFKASINITRLGFNITNSETENVTFHIYKNTGSSRYIYSNKSHEEFKIDAYPYSVTNNGSEWNSRVNILHISDNHITSSNAYENLKDVLNLADEVYDDGVLGCVVNTGDITNGANISKNTILSHFDMFTAEYKKHHVYHLCQVGNHDANNNADSISNMMTKSEMNTHLYSVVKNRVNGSSWGSDESGYFYKNITQGEKTIRIIMLDMLDHLDDVNYKCHWRTVYSQNQIDWLINAMKVPDGYGIIICNHFPFAPNLSSGYSEEHPALNDGVFAQGWKMIPEIVEAWQNRTTINKTYNDTINNSQNIVVNADFSSVSESCQFVCFMCGHTHSKNNFKVEDSEKQFNQVMLCEDSSGQTGKALNRAFKFANVEGLNTACSMVSVDMRERKIYRTAYGAYKHCIKWNSSKTVIINY